MRAPSDPGRTPITASAAHRTAGDHIARGIAFALIAFSIFSCADAGVKWLTRDYSVFQIIFVSNLFTLIPVAFLVRREGGIRRLRPRHPWLVGLRSILLAIDMVLVFYAFVELPLADGIRLEGDLSTLLRTTEDRLEGAKGFLEKRKPRWTGR